MRGGRVADEKDASERAKEILVYGPIGLALYVRDTAPSFLKLFVARGRTELDHRRRSVEGQIDQARVVGETAAASGAPQVLRLVSEGLSAVRAHTEDALSALGVLAADDTEGAVASEPAPPMTPSPSATAAAAPSPEPDATGARPNGSTPVLAIPDYDELSASQVVDRLEGLSPVELEAIRTYESAHRARNTILGKIEQLTRGA
jgi:hypothetical protein